MTCDVIFVLFWVYNLTDFVLYEDVYWSLMFDVNHMGDMESYPSADLEVQLVQLNHCNGEYSNY